MIKITDDNFDEVVLKSNSPVLVDCYTLWCGPCKALKPLLVKMEEERGDFTLGLLDIENNPQLADRLRVTSVPKVLVFNKGQEIAELIGMRSKDDYCDVLDSIK